MQEMGLRKSLQQKAKKEKFAWPMAKRTVHGDVVVSCTYCFWIEDPGVIHQESLPPVLSPEWWKRGPQFPTLSPLILLMISDRVFSHQSMSTMCRLTILWILMMWRKVHPKRDLCNTQQQRWLAFHCLLRALFQRYLSVSSGCLTSWEAFNDVTTSYPRENVQKLGGSFFL